MSGQEDALVESGGLPPVARGSKGIRARESERERESSEIERGGREREREEARRRPRGLLPTKARSCCPSNLTRGDL